MILVYAGTVGEYLNFLKEWQLKESTPYFKFVSNVTDIRGYSIGCPFLLIGSWKWRRDASAFFDIVIARNFIEMVTADV